MAESINKTEDKLSEEYYKLLKLLEEEAITKNEDLLYQMLHQTKTMKAIIKELNLIDYHIIKTVGYLVELSYNKKKIDVVESKTAIGKATE